MREYDKKSTIEENLERLIKAKVGYVIGERFGEDEPCQGQNMGESHHFELFMNPRRQTYSVYHKNSPERANFTKIEKVVDFVIIKEKGEK